MRWMLRSKIHQATVTEADLQYVGSITIDEELMERVGLLPGERVLVVSNTSGARLETYTIPAPRGSGAICMNGAAAHLIRKGEEIIIMGFELADRPVESKQIVLGPNNEFVRWLTGEACNTCLAEMGV
ncbi:MAG TPA: aspartate 1-decarboxylase [Candidatus Binatia bacterium]|nr:aspartate 1-decarboxylase [Candidatus Binatia bacterium]